VFERYTERARRALFFARAAVSTVGGTAIETEHLLLGLIRASEFTCGLLDRAQVDSEIFEMQLEQRLAAGERVPATVEIPFSEDVRSVLAFAVTEADRLGHNYIGPEHLLMGILSIPKSGAAEILASSGIDEALVRQEIARMTNPPDT
jgi:ATP-dependent Clp protease ATP-binding subunit ClpC